MRKVFITGIGAISSLGKTIEAHRSALIAGKTGMGKAKHFQSSYSEKMPFAEIDASDTELKKSLSINELGFNRTALIALFAFDQAILDADLSPSEISDFSTAFISSSTVGGMCNTIELYQDANHFGEPSEFVDSYEGSDHLLRIVKRYRINGYTDTLNTACSSSANAIMLGARLIQTGRAKRVIVGGADCLAKFTVNGFNALRILSEEPCKPFDRDREGLTLGEAAAYLVLESDEIVGTKKKYAEVVGFGNTNDAFHPSATSDEAVGPLSAMQEALRIAGLSPENIDYINAHGTGTPNNDQTESFAFSKLFEKVPPFNSTKSYTGHTLAAAGALEALFSILSLTYSELYPSLQVESPIEEFDFKPITSYQSHVELKHVMSNSFGFGGNCTSLILSKCL